MTNEPKRPITVQIDMTTDGQFTGPQTAPIASRLLRTAIIIGVLSVAAALVALTLWVALALIPIALAIGLMAYLAIRFQIWRRGGLRR